MSLLAPGRAGCGMGTVGEGDLGLTPGFSKMSVLGISRGWHSGWGKQTNRSVQRHVGGMIFLLEELLFFHRAKKPPSCERTRAPCEWQEAKWENCICWIVLCLLSGGKKKLDKEMKFDSRYSRPKTGSQAGMGFFSLRITE